MSGSKRRLARDTRALLVEHFPKCFAPKGEPKRPLKVGIHEDIKARLPELAQRSLFIALADYTSGSSYLGAMTDGATRVDLDGEPAGIVTADAAHFVELRAAGKKRIQNLEATVRTMAAALRPFGEAAQRFTADGIVIHSVEIAGGENGAGLRINLGPAVIETIGRALAAAEAVR